MNLSELTFDYPEHQIATQPVSDFRLLVTEPYKGLETSFREIQLDHLWDLFQAGDLLVINNTQVIPRRVFSQDDLEIVFLESDSLREWTVLFPAKKLKIGDSLTLPGEVSLTLLSKGIPQVVKTSRILDNTYFLKYGEVPLPPYIQKARGERHSIHQDEQWYQSDWAKAPGSLAAPTASLHFSRSDLDRIQARGVHVAEVTLHVGLGTFLPVKCEDLNDHKMHKEWVHISQETWQKVQDARSRGNRVWALGTTALRALEACARGDFSYDSRGYVGYTDLFILPGFEFKVVGGLMTNFHQPKSTLLALVAAFAGIDHVQQAYQWAIQRGFRLFSYGDITVWTR